MKPTIHSMEGRLDTCYNHFLLFALVQEPWTGEFDPRHQVYMLAKKHSDFEQGPEHLSHWLVPSTDSTKEPFFYQKIETQGKFAEEESGFEKAEKASGVQGVCTLMNEARARDTLFQLETKSDSGNVKVFARAMILPFMDALHKVVQPHYLGGLCLVQKIEVQAEIDRWNRVKMLNEHNLNFGICEGGDPKHSPLAYLTASRARGLWRKDGIRWYDLAMQAYGVVEDRLKKPKRNF